MKWSPLLILAFIGFFASAQDLKILVPRTLSSLPVLELRDTLVGQKKVQVEIFDDHPQAMAALLSGKADVLMTGFSTGLSRYLTSGDIKHLGTSVWGVSSLVALDPALKTLADFQGLTIMAPFAGSPLDIQLKVLLEKAGLTGKVTLDYAPIQQQIPLLLQKKVAGICVPEPLVSKLISQNGAQKVFTFGEKWAGINQGDPRSPQVSFYVLAKGGPGDKELLEFMEALKTTTQNLSTKASLWADKFSPELQVPPALILQGLKNTILEVPDQKTSRGLIENYLKLTKEAPKLPGNDFYRFP